MYVNNIRIERISSCCEYKYNKGAKLGTGTIQFLSVEGAAPCFKCNVRRGYLKVQNYKKRFFDEKTKIQEKPDPAPRPVSRASSIKSRSSKKSSAPRSHADQEEIKNADLSDSESEKEQEEKEVVQSVEVSPEESVKAAEAESLAESNSGLVLNRFFF